MVIDIRGKNDDETYLNCVMTMAALRYTPIRVVCQSCGEDAYLFRDYLVDEEGYAKDPCYFCGGKMKKDE